MEMIKKLTVDDVKVNLSANEEDCTPFESMRGTSEEEAKQFAQAVEDMRCVDPDWGWCIAVVHVTWGPFESRQYLGGCSYKSADDFKEDSGYYDGMVKDAIDGINTEIQEVLVDLREKGCI